MLIMIKKTLKKKCEELFLKLNTNKDNVNMETKICFPRLSLIFTDNQGHLHRKPDFAELVNESKDVLAAEGEDFTSLDISCLFPYPRVTSHVHRTLNLKSIFPK